MKPTKHDRCFFFVFTKTRKVKNTALSSKTLYVVHQTIVTTALNDVWTWNGVLMMASERQGQQGRGGGDDVGGASQVYQERWCMHKLTFEHASLSRVRRNVVEFIHSSLIVYSNFRRNIIGIRTKRHQYILQHDGYAQIHSVDEMWMSMAHEIKVPEWQTNNVICVPHFVAAYLDAGCEYLKYWQKQSLQNTLLILSYRVAVPTTFFL